MPRHVRSVVAPQRNGRPVAGDPNLCSVSGSGCEYTSTANGVRNVSAQAAAAPAAPAKAWWKEYPHLWVDVRTQEEFIDAVDDDNYDLVLVGT